MTPLANIADRDKRAYDLAFKYLQIDPRVTSEIIERYLSTPLPPNDIQGIFRRLLESAKNAGMKPNVIKDIADLQEALCDYNPSAIIQRYHGKNEELLTYIMIEKAKTGRPITPGRIWRSYCRSIIEGASFLNRFSTVKEFHDYVAIFHDNPITLPALPLLRAKEIHGLGFALACDFLKEIGYQNYSKPDRYLKIIIPELKLSEKRNDLDLVVFRAVTRIAANTGRTAFAVDKLFWLTGSGYFYPINGLGLGKVRYAEKFVNWAKLKLG